MITNEGVAGAAENVTAPLPPRPHNWTRETAALVADELCRRAAFMRGVADAIEADVADIGPSTFRDGALHGYRQLIEHLEHEAADIVRHAEIYWTAYELARDAARGRP